MPGGGRRARLGDASVPRAFTPSLPLWLPRAATLLLPFPAWEAETPILWLEWVTTR